MGSAATGAAQNAVFLSAKDGEYLEYTITTKGSRVNFSWLDDTDTEILSHNDFALGQDPVVWQLKTSVNGQGQVVLTVPQKGTYSRTVAINAAMAYGLVLAFVTAVDYRLTVNHMSSTGVLVEPAITDVNIKMTASTDPPVKAALLVNV